MLRQGHLAAVVVATFVIGCAFLLGVGCSGTRMEAPKEKGHTEATNTEQGRTAEATSEDQARCDRTRRIKKSSMRDIYSRKAYGGFVGTNDVPGCPPGGLLLGTDKADRLLGHEGDDEIRGLDAGDFILGGVGDDVIHGGPGDDNPLSGDTGDDVIYGGAGDDLFLAGKGADVIYGEDGSDYIDVASSEVQPDKLYCGKGKDKYHGAEKMDYVSSSCEKEVKAGIPPARGE
jgi:hypothetical protein